MDSGLVALLLAECALIWFAIKTYVDKSKLESDNERLKDKIEELKNFIRDSK